ncbi:MAG: ATP-binding protein [Candidatus Firestonebacteria bacterium]
MIRRILSDKLLSISKYLPVVAIIGPRQSGKTTLVKSVFKNYKYISLEDEDNRNYAMQDPRGFLYDYCEHGGIIDEAQRVPKLFSYIQTNVDNNDKPGRIILTGSQNFLLMEKVSQTLAGRIGILNLFPFSLPEINFGKFKSNNPDKFIFNGFYPRLYDKTIKPEDWFPGYVQTYLERDLRQMLNVSDLSNFRIFVKLCSARTGQILNLTSLGSDCGISHNTAKSWLSILEISGLVFLLRPYYKNYNKRLTKMPKLYFHDTGLVCFLLGIKDVEQLRSHYLFGSIFETFIISEIFKHYYNIGIEPPCYYWRENHGKEIDCLIDEGASLKIVEIKSGKTINDEYFNGLRYWSKLNQRIKHLSFIFYRGEEEQKREYGTILSWKHIENALH